MSGGWAGELRVELFLVFRSGGVHVSKIVYVSGPRVASDFVDHDLDEVYHYVESAIALLSTVTPPSFWCERAVGHLKRARSCVGQAFDLARAERARVLAEGGVVGPAAPSPRKLPRNNRDGGSRAAGARSARRTENKHARTREGGKTGEVDHGANMALAGGARRPPKAGDEDAPRPRESGA